MKKHLDKSSERRATSRNLESLLYRIAWKPLLRKTSLLAIFIALVGFGIRLWMISVNGGGELDWDEANVAWEAKNILANPWLLPFQRHNWQAWGVTHPYTKWFTPYVTAVAFALLGESEFTARLPSTIFGSLSLLMVYLLASKLYDRKVGLLSAFLLAISSFTVVLNQEAKWDTLLTFFILLSAYLSYSWAAERRKGYLVGAVVSACFASFTKETGLFFAFLLIGFQMVTWRGLDWLRERETYVAAVVAAALALPAALGAYMVKYQYYRGVPGEPGGFLVEAIILTAANVFMMPLWVFFLFLLVCLLSLYETKRRADIFVLAWILLIYISATLPVEDFYPRYILPAVPALYILACRSALSLPQLIVPLKDLTGKAGQKRFSRSQICALAVVGLIMLGYFTWSNVSDTYVFGSFRQTISAHKLAAFYVKDHSAPNAIIACDTPTIIRYYADREVIDVSNVSKIDRLATYLVIDMHAYGSDREITPELQAYLNTRCRLEETFRDGWFIINVYRILPKL
jgi:4-amino-4-deoxy-L-arabinose transferase-like glycosyltransferase